MPLPACDQFSGPAPTIVHSVAAPAAEIIPAGEWKDDRNRLIQAHGGAVLRIDNTFYWFGEDRSTDNLKDHRYVACYSSTDLMNWTFRRQVVAATRPQGVSTDWWTLERPKVYHNRKTGKFVMYVHIDGLGYKLASVAVFISDTVDGDYRFVRLFRPFDLESRDIGQFVDDDGSAYLIFESRPSHGFFIARLSEDYLDIAKKTCFIKKPMEGGTLVHYQGMYYLVASSLTGWAPNADKYASSTKLEGPWSEFKDIAPPAAKTYGSQSTFLLPIVGSQRTDVVFMGDIWKPKALWDSRYYWMPLTISDGTLSLPAPRPWAIDVATGIVTYR